MTTTSRRILAIVALVLLLLAGCRHTTHRALSHAGQTVSIQPQRIVQTASDDTELLSFVLTKQQNGSRQGYVIAKETIPLNQIDDMLSFKMHRRRHPKKEMREAFDDFVRRNKSPGTVPPLNLNIPLIYSPHREIDAAFKNNYWVGFYKKFPNTQGKFTCSLPGYSANRNTAIVYFEIRRGMMAARGELLIMEKKAGAWKVKETLTGWKA